MENFMERCSSATAKYLRKRQEAVKALPEMKNESFVCDKSSTTNKDEPEQKDFDERENAATSSAQCQENVTSFVDEKPPESVEPSRDVTISPTNQCEEKPITENLGVEENDENTLMYYDPDRTLIKTIQNDDVVEHFPFVKPTDPHKTFMFDEKLSKNASNVHLQAAATLVNAFKSPSMAKIRKPNDSIDQTFAPSTSIKFESPESEFMEPNCSSNSNTKFIEINDSLSNDAAFNIQSSLTLSESYFGQINPKQEVKVESIIFNPNNSDQTIHNQTNEISHQQLNVDEQKSFRESFSKCSFNNAFENKIAVNFALVKAERSQLLESSNRSERSLENNSQQSQFLENLIINETILPRRYRDGKIQKTEEGNMTVNTFYKSCRMLRTNQQDIDNFYKLQKNFYWQSIVGKIDGFMEPNSDYIHATLQDRHEDLQNFLCIGKENQIIHCGEDFDDIPESIEEIEKSFENLDDSVVTSTPKRSFDASAKALEAPSASQIDEFSKTASNLQLRQNRTEKSQEICETINSTSASNLNQIGSDENSAVLVQSSSAANLQMSRNLLQQDEPQQEAMQPPKVPFNYDEINFDEFVNFTTSDVGGDRQEDARKTTGNIPVPNHDDQAANPEVFERLVQQNPA